MLRSWPLALAALCLVGCSVSGTAVVPGANSNGATPGQSSTPATGKAVARVTLAPDTLVLETGNTRTDLLPTVNYVDGTKDSNVVWSSSDDRIASVEPTTGRIQAIKEGNVTIIAASANDPSQRATLQLSVRKGATGEAFVEITPASVSLKPKETSQLTGRVQRTDGTGTPNLTWKSANEAVATVSSAGLVTAIAPGKTTVTATANGDATRTASATVEVTADAAASK